MKICMHSSAVVAMLGMFATQAAFSADVVIVPKALQLNIGYVSVGDGLMTNVIRQSISPLESLPTIGEHPLSPNARVGISPAFIGAGGNLVWKSYDASPERQAMSAGADPCPSRGGETPVTRAAAWEVAYGCIRALATRDDSNGARLLDTFARGKRLYGIEPALESMDDEALAHWQKQADNDSTSSSVEATASMAGANTASATIMPVSRVKSPSVVWPGGVPGWQLGDAYSQLARAYATVFPRGLATEGSVLVAHLDTGYFWNDKLRPKYLDKSLSLTCLTTTSPPCQSGAEASWDAKGIVTPGHGPGTLSTLAAGQYRLVSDGPVYVMGGNPSAHVFSIKIHDIFVHLDPRRMSLGIEAAVNEGADLISLSHGGLPSLQLATAVNYAYDNGTPIFAASSDFLEYPFFMGRTFQSIAYPARFRMVMAVAGVTEAGRSYGDNPSLWWWFSFGPGYFSRLSDWALRGSFGPAWVMGDDHVMSAYVPNVTHSSARPGDDSAVVQDGGGTSHATPQVSAAASLWLESHRDELKNDWRTWRKSEAVYQALMHSSNRCFADYNVEHYGAGVLRAADALGWHYAVDASGARIQQLARNGSVIDSAALVQRDKVDSDWDGAIQLFFSAKWPQDMPESLQQAFANSLATELAQLIFTSDRLQAYLQSLQLCRPESGCERCTRADLKFDSYEQWRAIVEIVQTLPEASSTLKRMLGQASRNAQLTLD